MPRSPSSIIITPPAELCKPVQFCSDATAAPANFTIDRDILFREMIARNGAEG